MARVYLAFLLLLRCVAMPVHGLNITQILAPYPNYSLFSQWLSSTGVANEVNNRSSITILATPNDNLQDYLSAAKASTPAVVADALRYQILLTYFGMAELQKIPVKNHTSATTMLQTTGQFNATQGFVTIYNTGAQYLIGHSTPDSSGNQTIVTNVTQLPYEYSVLQLSSILLPLPPSLLPPSPSPTPSFTPPPTPTPSPAPASTPTPARSPVPTRSPAPSPTKSQAPVPAEDAEAPGPAVADSHASVISIGTSFTVFASFLAAYAVAKL